MDSKNINLSPRLSPFALPGRYLDVVNRLDAVVVAIEKQDNPVIIVSHQVCHFSLRLMHLFVLFRVAEGFPSDFACFCFSSGGEGNDELSPWWLPSTPDAFVCVVQSRGGFS